MAHARDRGGTVDRRVVRAVSPLQRRVVDRAALALVLDVDCPIENAAANAERAVESIEPLLEA